MQVSAITAKDLEDLKDLQPDGWPDLIPHFTFYTNSAFCKPIKFCKNNRIIGIGSAILHRSTAWLGHIIVHKNFRNQGLGSTITQTLIDRLDKQVKTISLIATDLGEPVYKKLGFVRETEYYFFKKDDHKPHSFESDRIRNTAFGFENSILTMDKKVWGEGRISLLDSHLSEARICVEENNLTGFYLPALGEGLIVATNTSAGLELSRLRMSAHNFTVLPKENEAAIRLLTDNDYKFIRSAARMRLGEETGFKGEMLYSRIGGNLG